jgi:hypothetical protein
MSIFQKAFHPVDSPPIAFINGIQSLSTQAMKLLLEPLRVPDTVLKVCHDLSG